jgi:hypothetical protein
MARYLLILFLLAPIMAMSQSKVFPLDKESFMKELESFMKANNNEEGRNALESFKVQVEEGNLTDTQIEQLSDLCTAMQGKKMRPSPAYSALLNTATAFCTSGRLPNEFDQWMTVSTDVLANNRGANFVKFMEFAGPFFGQNALYFTRGKSWNFYSYDFQLSSDNGEPSVAFNSVSLTAVANNDRTGIYDTKGVYFPLQNTFEGSGGRVNWMKAQLDSNNVYAVVPDYSINLEKAEYQIDSVTFYFIGYLDKALKGTFTDKLLSNVDPENMDYPQFRSYENSIEIRDIIDYVDYYGSFYLKGNSIMGSGDGQSLATLKFRDDLERHVMTTRSKSYLIKPDAIFSQAASITIHLGSDSIYHPNVNLNYKAPNRTVTLTRGDIGSAGSDYYSSYHRIDADIEQVIWGINDTTLQFRNLRGAGEQRAYFESEDLFSLELYNNVQSISPANPLVLIKRYCERNDIREVDAEVIARVINPSLTIDGIRSLLYQLMLEGFLFYDPETNIVTVKDKTFNYVNSYIGKKDYDIISMMSKTDEANAELNLRKNEMHLKGIEQVYLSDSQFVLVYPDSGDILMRRDRDMLFSGRVVAGTADFVGNNFFFDYDTFDIKMNNVDSMILYVESTEVDEFGNVLFLPIRTSFSILQGKLQIDRADNKSSREDYPEYPIFYSYATSKADYDKAEVLNNAYDKEEFYFEVDPFTIQSLDRVDYTTQRFGGTMVSDGIFPEFEEELSLQPDRSLGFRTQTPPGGLPMYGGAGNFTDSIFLSNDGFLGAGRLDFMASTSTSRKFTFLPDSTYAPVDSFVVEKTVGGTEFPSVVNTNVDMTWIPADDYMSVRKKETNFDFFDGISVFDGNLVVTSFGLFGNGNMSWQDADLRSREFFFGAMTMQADTSALTIKSIREGVFALTMDNVSSNVDFDSQHGLFKANIDTVLTKLPYNMYKTNINEFDWDMANKFIDFSSTDREFGTFYSMEPTQDSLSFQGTNGRLDLTTYVLGVEGIPHISIADSRVLPDSGKAYIEADAKMRTLENAKIVGDSIMAYQTIHSATLDIWGRNSIKGSGLYTYTSPQGKAQDIPIEEITVIKEIDSLTDFENYYIKALGYVPETEPIEIEKKVEFKGPVSLMMKDERMRFFGYARINLPDTALPTDWFRIDTYFDPYDPKFGLNIATNETSDSVYAGVIRSFDSTNLYVRVMGSQIRKPDPVIYAARGVGYYDEANAKWLFGNMDKTFDPTLPGSLMTYDEVSGDMEGMGTLHLGFEDHIVETRSYGTIMKRTEDTLFFLNATIAVNIPWTNEHMKKISDLLYGSNVENPLVDHYSNNELLAALHNLGDEKQVEKMYDNLNSVGYLERPKDVPFTLLLSNLKLVWDQNTKSFHSATDLGELIWLGDQQFNQEMKVLVELGKKTGGEHFTIYLETPYGDYLYINTRRNLMKIHTSNDDINEDVFSTDAGKRTIEGEGKRVVYQLQSKPQVGKFVRDLEDYLELMGDIYPESE